MNRITQERVMSHMDESFTYMSHVTFECVMTHTQVKMITQENVVGDPGTLNR